MTTSVGYSMGSLLVIRMKSLAEGLGSFIHTYRGRRDKVIFYLIKGNEFTLPLFMLRTQPPQLDTPETLVAEVDIATIEGNEEEVKHILTGMHGA